MGSYKNNKDGTNAVISTNIQVVDAPMEEFLSRGEFNAITPNDVGTQNKLVAENEVTKAYDTMPTASELIEMPDNTLFETKGFYEKGDGADGKYLITSTYTNNSKRVSSGGVTKYLLTIADDGATTDVIDVVKFGLRPYRGALSGTLNPTDTYATANSAIMSAITTLSGGVTFRFGYGRYVFADPLVLTSTRINLKGVETPMSLAQTNANYANGTVLCFPFLTDGQIAIDAIGGNMEDIMVYGSLGTYNISFDRTKTIEHPEQVITEVNNAECTGIHRISGGHMRNVAVMGFYKGIDLETANWYLEDIYCSHCHFGLVVFRDAKCVGVYGKDVHTLATIKGSASSIQQLRVDSCVHAVHVQGGYNIILNDIDGDYCTESLIELGDTNYQIYNASFTGIHGRCCALKAYDTRTYPNGLDVRTIADTSGYGVIRVRSNTKIYKSYFQFSSNGGRTPFDSNQGIVDWDKYECPHILITYENTQNARLKDSIFSFPSDDIKTPDDVLKFFEGVNGTPTYKVDTSNNTYYVEGNSVKPCGGIHYSTMPSTADLFALPNNTVFETDGYWAQRDGNGGKYIISTSALRGGLEITDGTNTRYLCVLDDYGNPANEINVCKYGIREYAGNLYTDTITKENTFATQNSHIITHIYLMKQRGTLKFPKGRFVFADPIDFTTQNARNNTLEGACVPVMSSVNADYIANTSDSSPATILCFPFLQNGQTAITIRNNISNLIVYGNFHTYDITFDRTKTITAPDEVVTETITDNIQCTGITSTAAAFIQNVIVAGFYKGIERPAPSNGYFFNITFVRCHYGININGDNKAIGIYGWGVHTLIRVAGASLQSVEQARVDSCVHMVELRGCKGVTLHDFDGDYCTDSMVLVEGGAEAIIATAFHARCNTLKSYDGTNADPIDVRDLADTSGYGIIRIANSMYLKNCHFSFNRIGGQNPFDTASNYKTPETVLTMDNWAKFEDCTFELPITAVDSDYILSLFQTNANCKSRVDTSSGTYYIEGTTAKDSVDPATDIDFSTLFGGD